MELTKLQKKIIDSMIKHDVYDILTFIYKFLDYIPHEETIKILGESDLARFSDPRGELLILRDLEKSSNEIKEYIVLVEKFKREFLVVEFEKGDHHYEFYDDFFLKFPKMLIRKNEKIQQASEIHDLAYRYGTNYIMPMPDLLDFKNRGYKTLEEKRFESEVADRRTAMNWTKAIALISIFGVLFSTLFNFFTNKNERIIEIKSMPKTDTIKAYILHNSTLDSTLDTTKLLPISKSAQKN